MPFAAVVCVCMMDTVKLAVVLFSIFTTFTVTAVATLDFGPWGRVRGMGHQIIFWGGSVILWDPKM